MINAYVGCAIDSTVRYMATSGGVGSYLLKYLFDKGEILQRLLLIMIMKF